MNHLPAGTLVMEEQIWQDVNGSVPLKLMIISEKRRKVTDEMHHLRTSIIL
jgi:hypothetical protein